MCCTGVVMVLVTLLAVLKHCGSRGCHVANLKPSFFLVLSYLVGLLGNVAMLTAVHQAYGKPSPSFLAVCLARNAGSHRHHVTHPNNTATTPNNTVTTPNNTMTTPNNTMTTLPRHARNILLSSDSTYLSHDICLNHLAAQHCRSFYCPHSTLLLYTATFIFKIVDLALPAHILITALLKCACGCVALFVSFDTVQRNLHDVVDVGVGGAVGALSGWWVLKSVYEVLSVRRIKILDFTERRVELEGHGIEELDFVGTKSDYFTATVF